MSLFKKIDSLLDEIVYAPYMETSDGVWCLQDEDTVYWVNGVDVYLGEIREGVHKQDDCTFINIDNGCGETITKVFNNFKELSYDNFYNNYEEYM